MMRLPSLSKLKSEVSGQSGHCSARLLAALRANNGLVHRSKKNLLDHLVGAAKQRKRDRQAERPSGFEVNDQLDFSRLVNRQVSRLGTFENSPCVDANLPIGISKIGSIAHEPARCREPAVRINRGNGVTRREHDKSNGSVG